MTPEQPSAQDFQEFLANLAKAKYPASLRLTAEQQAALKRVYVWLHLQASKVAP